MVVVATEAVWRADRGGHGRLTELVVAVVVVLVVVVCGRLAEEGLHPRVAAVVEHDDLDDLLTLDEGLGPQVSQADGRLKVVLLLEVEVVGRGARRRLQLRALRWRCRPMGSPLGPLLEKQRPLVVKKGHALGTRSRAAAELVRLKPVVN